jgi:ribonuclease PH
VPLNLNVAAGTGSAHHQWRKQTYHRGGLACLQPSRLSLIPSVPPASPPWPESSSDVAGEGPATTAEAPGPRRDGRAADDQRPVRIVWDPMGFALSSLTIETGRTRVLCSVCLEEELPRWRRGSGSGWLSAEYRLLPASTPSRQPRELMKLSGRTQEIQRLIGRSLRASLDLAALGERSLLVDCDVLQADAGTRTAAITGAWLAVAAALERLQRRGVLSASPLRQQVAAISVGLVEGQPLLDLDYSEDSRADVDLNVVMDGEQRLLEIQGTAEGAPFSRGQLDALLDLAGVGIARLQELQRRALTEAAPAA